MTDITYSELVALCGKKTAYLVLLVIEYSAKVRKNNVVQLDCENRLRRAFDVMRENELTA